jgi:hypothetical protein
VGVPRPAALAVAALLLYALIVAGFSLACALNQRCDILTFFR